jgi:hypothetical protein
MKTDLKLMIYKMGVPRALCSRSWVRSRIFLIRAGMHHDPRRSSDIDHLDLGSAHCRCMAGAGDAVACCRPYRSPQTPHGTP